VAGGVRAHSFDVFDTALVRTFARPPDLFLELGRRLSADGRGGAGGGEEFAAARRVAEAAARRARTREEVTLAEIYAQLPEACLFGRSREEAAAEEVRLESESVRPVLEIRKAIDEARARGVRVLFISDMYLPSGAVRRMLLEAGLAREEDKVYLSSEEGVTKHNGGLFRRVLERESLAASELVHCGDNPHSDVRVPRRLGISCRPFRGARLNGRERAYLESVWPRGEWPLRMAGISRAVRLMLAGEAGDGIASLVAGLVGPLLASFVRWTLAEARRRGIGRLYFVSRDGQILLRAAREMCAGAGGPELRYLYGSRQAWFLPSVKSCDRESLSWLMPPGHSRAPRVVLARLGVEPGEVESALKRHGFDSSQVETGMDAEECERFWRFLSDGEVSQLVLQKAQAARRLLTAYLRRSGLFEAGWALVDVGWTLKTQKALWKVLREGGAGDRPAGFYLGVSRDHVPAAEAGEYDAFFGETEEEPDPSRPLASLFNFRTILEHAFTAADHGTVDGYRKAPDGVEPVLREHEGGGSGTDLVSRLHDSVAAYAREFSAVAPADPAELKAAGLWAAKALARYSLLPARGEVAPFSGVVLSDEQTGDRAWKLVRPLGVLDLVRLVFWGLYRILSRKRGGAVPGKDYYWLWGSLAISPAPIRLPVRLALRAGLAMSRIVPGRIKRAVGRLFWHGEASP
jgi:FMN phosphatase YigB (HAD superfamily)